MKPAARQGGKKGRECDEDVELQYGIDSVICLYYKHAYFIGNHLQFLDI
jgi:hypothetical protein